MAINAPKKLITKDVSLYFAVKIKNIASMAMIKKANKLSLNVPPNIIAKNGADNVKAVREALEFDFTKISLTENNRAIILTNTQGTELTIPLENYVSKMVTNILSEAFTK